MSAKAWYAGENWKLVVVEWLEPYRALRGRLEKVPASMNSHCEFCRCKCGGCLNINSWKIYIVKVGECPESASEVKCWGVCYAVGGYIHSQDCGKNSPGSRALVAQLQMWTYCFARWASYVVKCSSSRPPEGVLGMTLPTNFFMYSRKCPIV